MISARSLTQKSKTKSAKIKIDFPTFFGVGGAGWHVKVSFCFFFYTCISTKQTHGARTGLPSLHVRPLTLLPFPHRVATLTSFLPLPDIHDHHDHSQGKKHLESGATDVSLGVWFFFHVCQFVDAGIFGRKYSNHMSVASMDIQCFIYHFVCDYVCESTYGVHDVY